MNEHEITNKLAEIAGRMKEYRQTKEATEPSIFDENATIPEIVQAFKNKYGDAFIASGISPKSEDLIELWVRYVSSRGHFADALNELLSFSKGIEVSGIGDIICHESIVTAIKSDKRIFTSGDLIAHLAGELERMKKQEERIYEKNDKKASKENH